MASSSWLDENQIGIVWEIQKKERNLTESPSVIHNKILQFEGKLPKYGPAFSPDEKSLIYLSQNQTIQNDDSDDDDYADKEPSSLLTVNIWNVESKSLHRQLYGHTDSIKRVGVSPGNLQIASISWDGTARVWDIESGLCLHTFGPYHGQLWSGAFSPNGEYLAFNQGNPKCYVHIYEISIENCVSSNSFHDLQGLLFGTMMFLY